MTSKTNSVSRKKERAVEHAMERITKTRVGFLLDNAFLAQLVMRLRVHFIDADDPRMGWALAYTDGRSLVFNVDKMKDVSNEELSGLLAHEILHCVFLHQSRRGARNPAIWNMACDYAINPYVLDMGLKLPEDGLLDEKFRGMTAETIYNKIIDDARARGEEGGEGYGSASYGVVVDKDSLPQSADSKGDRVIDANADGDGEPKPNGGKQDWAVWAKVAAQRAADQIRKKGDHPMGALLNDIAEVQRPRIDWRVRLRRFCEFTRDDFNWSRPERRFMSQGLHLPSRHSERVGELVVGIDTSGSISADDMELFFAEINSILNHIRPVRTRVMCCDAKVHSIVEYRAEELPIKMSNIELKGGGGTSFKPFFEAIEKSRENPECLIVLTDLYGDWPGTPPPYAVMWVVVGDGAKSHRPPFGEVAELEIAA